MARRPAKVVTKPPPQALPAHKATSEDVDRIVSLVADIDMLAGRAEQKWGVGRLPLLVGPELRLRFRQACKLWRAAIATYDPEQVRNRAELMKRAYAALDQEAERLGQQPIRPETWEARLPDGSVLVLVRSPAEAHHVAQQQAGRAAKVMDLGTAARLIARAEDIETQILLAFPGSTVAPERVLPGGYAESWAEDRPATDAFYGLTEGVLQNVAGDEGVED